MGRSREESTWRLDPEGEIEVSEIIIVSDAVKGTKVDLDGKGQQMKRMKEITKKWRQPKGADRTDMRKEEKRSKCALLNGSACSTEKKYMGRYKGTFDIFFVIRHGLRKEEMEEQSNNAAKEGWRFAADAARTTDERASSEDQKHTSGGHFVAVDSNLGAVVGGEQGAVTSTPGKKGRNAQVCVNVRGGCECLQHTSGTRRDGPQEMKLSWKRC